LTCENEIAQALRNSGLRVTVQRITIAAAVRHSSRHITAWDIFGEVSSANAGVAFSTVYRAVKTLRDRHLIAETSLADGQRVYEWSGNNLHHHLVCGSCERVFRLDEDNFANLRDKMLAEYGFTLERDSLSFAGTCGDCSITRQSDTENI
jgi:Fur family ferric uptake transcriptional regulator